MAKNHTGNDLEISGLGSFQGLRKANETLTSPFYLPSGQQLNHRIRQPWEPSGSGQCEGIDENAKELHRQTLRAFIEFRRPEMHVFGDNSAFLHLQQQQEDEEDTPVVQENDTQLDETAVEEEDHGS
ncbi:hypothetical protein AWENTII_011980 [Aspergillus wentii]